MVSRGKFVVVDGLDGIGKGVVLATLIEEAQKEKKRVVDINGFWKEHEINPPTAEIIGRYDVIVTSEPTYMGMGKFIREEMVAKGKNYPAEAVAKAYALDRRVLYGELVLPALETGIDVYQSRSFSTSIVYQRQQALDEGRSFDVDEIMSIPGNAFCAQHPMDYLVIPTVVDVDEVMRRLSNREKKDDCVFEVFDFQLKLKSHFESDEVKMFFERLGVSLAYIDAEKTVEHTQQQMRGFYEQHLKRNR